MNPFDSQFFKDDAGQKSMSRLLYFLSFWPSSYVIITDTSDEKFAWYISAFVVGVVGGKGMEAVGKLAQRPALSQTADKIENTVTKE